MARSRQLASWLLSSAATRYYRLDIASASDQDAGVPRVMLAFRTTLVVALAAHQAHCPDLRLSASGVVAHHLLVRWASPFRARAGD